MKPYKKSLRSKITMDRKEYKVWTAIGFDRWWDEGIVYHNMTKKTRNKPKRLLMEFQVRMYRTWKHNRRNQYR